jgi:predicted DNA-binding transcriptional regulator AlpA
MEAALSNARERWKVRLYFCAAPDTLPNIGRPATMATKAEMHDRLHPKTLDDPLFTSAEFASAINRHLLSLYRYMKRDKKFPPPTRMGGRLAWKKSEVLAYIDVMAKRGAEAREKAQTERGAQPKAKTAKSGAK